MNIPIFSRVFIILLVFSGMRLWGQEAGDIRISGVSSEVSDDSLRVSFTLTVRNLNVGGNESLTLFPRLTDGNTVVTLPAVVYSGRLRRKYDERKRIFSLEPQPAVYRTYTNIRRENEYRLDYGYSIPYFPRLKPDRLTVEYRYDDCCNTYPVREESYALAGIEHVQPAAEAAGHAAPSSVGGRAVTGAATRESRIRKETLYIEYPVNSYRILADYGRNREELARLDRLLENYRGTVWVSAYASPEGPYERNRALAENRAIGFRNYLRDHYGITSIPTAYIPEDWDGLRRLISEGSLPGKWEGLRIIDGVDIFAGREKRLMELHGGDFWKRLFPYFRQLRRIEVEIEED